MNLIDFLKAEEGFRDEVYLDSKGIPTCGWGHALHVGSRVPLSACQAFLDEDLAQVEEDYHKLGLSLNPVREAIVKAMIYQMGLGGVRKFKNFLSSARSGDWERAAVHMLDSLWAERDSSERAKRAAKMFREGKV